MFILSISILIVVVALYCGFIMNVLIDTVVSTASRTVMTIHFRRRMIWRQSLRWITGVRPQRIFPRPVERPAGVFCLPVEIVLRHFSKSHAHAAEAHCPADSPHEAVEKGLCPALRYNNYIIFRYHDVGLCAVTDIVVVSSYGMPFALSIVAQDAHLTERRALAGALRHGERLDERFLAFHGGDAGRSHFAVDEENGASRDIHNIAGKDREVQGEVSPQDEFVEVCDDVAMDFTRTVLLHSSAV